MDVITMWLTLLLCMAEAPAYSLARNYLVGQVDEEEHVCLHMHLPLLPHTPGIILLPHLLPGEVLGLQFHRQAAVVTLPRERMGPQSKMVLTLNFILMTKKIQRNKHGLLKHE